MARVFTGVLVALILCGAVAIKEGNARTPQDNAPDWYKYEAVRRIYKLGLPIVNTTKVTYHQAGDPPRAFCEDIVFVLDTKTIGHMPIRVRRFFSKEERRDWNPVVVQDFPKTLKAIRTKQQALDKTSDDRLNMLHGVITSEISVAWQVLNTDQLLKKLPDMDIFLGSPLESDQKTPEVLGLMLYSSEPGEKQYGTMDENIVEVVGQLRRAHKFYSSLADQALNGKAPPADRFTSAEREVYSAEAEFGIRYLTGYQKAVDAVKAALNK